MGLASTELRRHRRRLRAIAAAGRTLRHLGRPGVPALGDSYSSGSGLPEVSGACNRSEEYSYPKRDSPEPAVRHLRRRQPLGRHHGRTSTPPRTAPTPRRTDVVDGTDVVTFIGGNDLGFTDILTEQCRQRRLS
ncbi:MAG: hypothetical protein R2704_17485 [Microthrixaceae bacterium]